MGSRISDLPRRDRPRERLERLGAAALTDAELIALILRSGGQEGSALELAVRLLAGAGGVSSLSTSDVGALARNPSIGTAKASAIAAAFELGRRAAATPVVHPISIRDAADVAAVARLELTDPAREQAVVLVLNQRNRLLTTRRLTTGSATRCLLEPRDVLRTVVASGGTAFALAHNHPTGDLAPSQEDMKCTNLLRDIADAIGVRFLDHVIVSAGGWKSIVAARVPG